MTANDFVHTRCLVVTDPLAFLVSKDILTYIFKKDLIILCVWVSFLHVYLCNTCVLSSGLQEKVLGPLGLLLATMLVLRAQPSSSERTLTPLTTEPLSLSPASPSSSL